MKTLDPGHKYELLQLDGDGVEVDTYVKRIGDDYPGNHPPAYPGTVLQERLRAAADRLDYVNGQRPCAETEAAARLLETAVLLLEIRAKRVLGQTLYVSSLSDVVHAPVCVKCGHILCSRHVEAPAPGAKP